MSDPGSGGLTPPPLNLPGALPLVPGVQAGVQQAVIIANVVIVSGSAGTITGVFIYATGTTPGAGNPPIISITNQAADPFGNTVPQGFADTVGGIQGVLGPAGSDLMALVFNALTSPANTGPRLGVIQANSSGCKAELTSGLSLVSSTPATIALNDSASGGGTAILSLQANQVNLGALGTALWNDVIQQFSLPVGGGPFIVNESFHVITNAAGVGGTLRVKKLPWNAVWIDCECTFAYTAAAQTFIMGSLPDATYYPTVARRFPVSVTGTPSGITATFPRLFVPTSGAVQIVVPSGTVASGINVSGSFMYPTN